MIRVEKFSLLLLFFLCGLTGTVAADSSGNSPTDCFKTFTQSLNLTFPPNITFYSYAINRYRSGNLSYLCEAQTNLSQCLGSKNQSLTNNDMKSIFNANDTVSVQFLAYYFELQYGCGAPQYQLNNGIDCWEHSYMCYSLKPTNGNCPTVNFTCMSNSCGLSTSYIGCQWDSIYSRYTMNCNNYPSCDSYNTVWNQTVCFYKYFMGWGVPSDIFPMDSTRFQSYFRTYAIGSQSNFNAACQLYSDLYQCMGGTDDFLSTSNLTQILTIDNNTAANWIVNIQEQNFVCKNGMSGLKQYMECNDKYTTYCKTPTSSCNDTINIKTCEHQYINDKCGKTAAYYQCNADALSMKQNLLCGNMSLDCSQYNSGSAVGMGLLLILPVLLGFFN